MDRVMIVGGPGSGKSTLARWMAEQTGLRVQHMDQIHWLLDWGERTTAEKLRLIMAVEAEEHWTIEGGISSRYVARLERADVLIWLDLPVALRMWRVLHRAFIWKGRVRPDLPTGCPEHFNEQTLQFLGWVWTHRNTSRPKIVEALAQHSGKAAVHHLTSRRAVQDFQQAFATS